MDFNMFISNRNNTELEQMSCARRNKYIMRPDFHWIGHRA